MEGVLLHALTSGFTVLYVAVSIPFRCCFLEEFGFSRKHALWWALDYTTDAAMLASQFLQSKEEDAWDDRPSTRFEALWKRSRMLVFNVAATAPIEVLATKGTLAPFKLNRLLRLAHGPGCVRTIFTTLENKAKIEVGPLRMWLFFLIMAVAAHWAACLFYLASRTDAERDWARKRDDSTWGYKDSLWVLTEDGDVDFLVSVSHRYFRAYYWALVTMITVGFGDIVPVTRTETIVCILSMYTGMVISCAAIANLTLLVMSANKESLAHRGTIDAIRQYATYRHLPEATVRRMIDYVEHRWRECRGVDERRFRNELPTSLRQRSVKFKLHGLLRRLPVLNVGLANDAFVHAIALKLFSSVYAPWDQIVRPGEQLGGALIVSAGDADVLSRPAAPVPRKSISEIDFAVEDDLHKAQQSFGATAHGTVARLREGDFFGLASLFKVRLSKFLVQAHSFCEIYWVPRSVFTAVCREQCTSEQFEVMSQAIEDSQSGDGLKTMLYAGYGNSPQQSASPVGVRHRKRGKASHGAASILHHVVANTQRRRIPTSLKKVLPLDQQHDDDAPTDQDDHPREAHVLRPGTLQRDLLETAKLCLFLFYLIAIPLAVKMACQRSAVFKSNKILYSYTSKEALFVVSYLCDFLLVVDLVARATVLPELSKGVVVTRGTELRSLLIWRRKFAFFTEAVALLPWDGLALFFNKPSISVVAAARGAKIFVLVARLGPQTSLVLGYAASRFPIFNKQVRRIIMLNASMLLACHWVGCLWMLVGRISARHYDNKERSWISIDRSFNATSYTTLDERYGTWRWNHHSCASAASVPICTYIRSVYFAIVAMSTVGYGDIIPDASNLVETNFTSCVILFGGLMLPSVVGGLASLMADLNKNVREYRAKLSELYAAMLRQKLSSALQAALLQYHDYVWTRQKGVDELSVLANLPGPMRRDILNQTIGHAFSSAPFFARAAGVEDVAREELVARLVPRIFLPGDVILAEADLSRLSLFLIERGAVDLYAAKAGVKALDDGRKALVAQMKEDEPKTNKLPPLGKKKEEAPPPPQESAAAPAASPPTKKRRSRRSSFAIGERSRRSSFDAAIHAARGMMRATSGRYLTRASIDVDEESIDRTKLDELAKSVKKFKPFRSRRPSPPWIKIRGDSKTSLSSTPTKIRVSTSSKRRVMRLSRKLSSPTRKSSPDIPVLRAMCIPVMRRHKGDYFGAECLLDTSSGFKNKTTIHWSNAYAFASKAAKLRKLSKGGSVGPLVAKKSADNGRMMRVLDAKRRKTELEAYMRCAPQTSAVATSHTDCYELHRTQYFDVLKGFPSSATVISDRLREECAAENRRVKAMLANITRVHFSPPFARRVKCTDQAEHFSYATSAEDEICKLALCPDAINTVTSTTRRTTSQPAFGDGEAVSIAHTPGSSPLPIRRASIAAAQQSFARRRSSAALMGGPRRSSAIWGPSPSSSALMQQPSIRCTKTSRYSRSTLAEMQLGTLVRGRTFYKRSQRLRMLEFHIRSYMCDPESKGAVAWAGLMVLVVLYHTFSTPVHVAFLTRRWERYAMDWILDFIAIVDAILAARVFGYVSNGRLVVDPRRIFQRHRQSGNLVSNLVVCAPYELLGLAAGTPAWRRAVVALARLPKMARLVRLNHLMYSARTLFDPVEARVGNRTATLCRLLGAVFLISHIAACTFYLLARYRAVNKTHVSLEERWRCTWIRAQIASKSLRLHSGFGVEDQAEQYLRSLNWALPTLVVVVIGDVTPASCTETLFAFVCIALGMSVNAMIIGQVAAAVANSDASSTELSMRADRLDTFMQQHRVPLQLRARIHTFLNSLQMACDSSDPITGTSAGKALVHSALPHTLRARVCVEFRLPVLTRCPIFEACTEGLKRAIALYLSPETYSTGDLVVEYGDRGEAMYFLLKGAAQVVAENGTMVYATLKAGSFFGEGALFSNIRRMASIQCTCFSEALRLSRLDVQRQLRAFCFDQQLLLDTFNRLARRNKERNDAIQANLKAANNTNHRLARLLGMQQQHQLPTPAQQTNKDNPRLAAARFASRVFADDSWVLAATHAVAVLLTIATAIIGPYRAAFTRPEDLVATVPRRMGFEFACDVFFVLFLVVRSLKNSMATKKRRDVWFYVDVLAEAPLEIFAVLWGPTPVRKARNLTLACRLNRLLRLFRVKFYASNVLSLASLRIGWRFSAAEQAVVAVAVAYGLCNHWYACVWFAIHRYLEPHASVTWASADQIAVRGELPTRRGDRVCRVAVVDCYLRAVHMVITTISTVGYGDVKPQTPLETIWQLIVVISGACLFASLIGAFTLLLEDFDTEGSSAFNAKMQKYEHYMSRAKFPPQLRAAIVAHHQHRFKRTRCIDTKTIALDLTAPLRMDLALFLHRNAFERLDALRGLPNSTARRLADVLQTEICLRDERVYEVGDIGWDIYFIFKGVVRLTPPVDDSVLDAHGRKVLHRQDDDGDDSGSFRKTANLIQRALKPLPLTLADRDDDDEVDDTAALATMADDDAVCGLLAGMLFQGDHFGEYCLQFASGVRLETATAVKHLELYTVGRRDFEDKVAAYESDDVLAVLNDRLQTHATHQPFLSKRRSTASTTN